MNYDGLVLAAALEEIKSHILGAVIQGVRQHNDTDVTFEIRSRGTSYLLFTSIHPKFPRIHFTSSKFPVPQTPPAFCMLLRKHLIGSRIISIEQVGFDRIALFKTTSSDKPPSTLILELMGKHSNLILISETDRILGAIKHVSARISRYRQILPGLDYCPPPGAGKLNPITIDMDTFESVWQEAFTDNPDDESICAWLIAAFSGIGTFLAKELLLAVEDKSPKGIFNSLANLQNIVRRKEWKPVLITDEAGFASYAYPIPTRQHPKELQHERSSFNETLDTVFRSLIQRDKLSTEITSLKNSILKAIASRERTLNNLKQTIAEGKNAERLKQIGELILSQTTNIPKGSQTAHIIDYYDPEMRKIEVELDKKLSAAENAEIYFKRARKAQEGAEAAADRISEVQTEIEILRGALDSLAAVDTPEKAQSLRSVLVERDLLRQESLPQSKKREEEHEFAGYKIKRVISADGFEILYGENSQSNDYLTTKIAKPNDLWFHARAVKGAHVIIRTANKPHTVPPGTIRHAAEIAASNSDAKHSKLVPVDYTLKKYVRKPRASAPGFVTYQNEKTMYIVPNTH